MPAPRRYTAQKASHKIVKLTRDHTWPQGFAEWKSAVVDFLADAMIIFILVFAIVRPFVAAPFQVQQNSMEPNIHDGEYIIVSKLPYNEYIGWKSYERGDIVVFRPSTNPETYLIKRVIGLPGETLRIIDGAVYLRDDATGAYTRLADDYLDAGNQGNTCARSGTASCNAYEKRIVINATIPEGHYFVLGDNRLVSRDSRSCFLGSCRDEDNRFVAYDEIEGRAYFTFFPLGDARLIQPRVGGEETAVLALAE
jgi:signal peptidase I